MGRSRHRQAHASCGVDQQGREEVATAKCCSPTWRVDSDEEDLRVAYYMSVFAGVWLLTISRDVVLVIC